MTNLAYSTVYDTLRRRIMGKYYTSGQKLPPERQLCRQLGVSRITIRRALDALAEQGLVIRRQGRGTFIRQPRPEKLTLVAGDFTGSIRRSAARFHRQLLRREEKTALPPGIASLARWDQAAPCLLIERLDILDGEPWAYDQAYLPQSLAEHLDDEILVRVDFLEAWLAAEKLQYSHTQETIEAVPANTEAARRLNVPRRSPLLKTTEVIYAQPNRPIGVFLSFYRGDRIKFTSTLRSYPHLSRERQEK